MFKTFVRLGLCLWAVSLVSCDQSVCDEDTGLCWQKVQREGLNSKDQGVIPREAYAYCDNLEWDGHDDWRLPTFAELRTIVRGNPAVEPGGQCAVGGVSGTKQGETPSCATGGSSGAYKGPGKNGCYWQDQLDGLCNKDDPAVVGHPLETWALDVAMDDPKHWVSYITFDTGAAGYNHSCSLGEVRCVRGGEKPAPCLIDGKPCHSYYPSKAFCNQDVTQEADALKLTIRLSEPLQKQPPHQLMAFFYKADPSWFPPLGPPDGGIDENQIILDLPDAPAIGKNQPLEMMIPATTYYREETLKGAYQLFVGLYLEDQFPPIPQKGDMLWGEGQAPFEFPLNGIKHEGAVLEVDITLEPVGCPQSQPVFCPDAGVCVVDAAACPKNKSDCPGGLFPEDGGVISCRYENQYDGGKIACADFPKALGWTIDEVKDFCPTISGAKKAVVGQGDGESCLVRRGVQAKATRCTFQGQEKDFFGYNVPKVGCRFGGGRDHSSGPFCKNYGGRDAPRPSWSF